MNNSSYGEDQFLEKALIYILMRTTKTLILMLSVIPAEVLVKSNENLMNKFLGIEPLILAHVKLQR